MSEDQAHLGAVALLDALQRADEPFDLALRIVSTQGRISLAFVVSAFDTASSIRAARRMAELAAACLPWYGFETSGGAPGRSFDLPAATAWASRLHRDENTAPRVRAGHGSALSRLLRHRDMVLSARIGGLFDPEMPGTVEIVVASDTSPTDTAASLVALEIGGDDGVLVRHAAGEEQTRRMLESHRFDGGGGLAEDAFATLLALPARTRVGASWRTVPASPASPARLLEAATQHPELHRWIIGRSGTGKSTLVEHLIARDVAAGKALLVIDPHGDLAPRVATIVDSERPDELDYLDFADPRPPRFNLLAVDDGQTEGSVINEVVELARNLFEDAPEDWFGPVYHRTMRWALRLVMEGSPAPDLSTLIRVLSGDAETIEGLLKRADDPDLELTWEREMRACLGTTGEGNLTPYITSKLDPLVSDAQLREVFAPDADGPTPPAPGYRVGHAVRSGRVVVVRAPIGKLGLAATRTLATAFVQRAAAAVTRGADGPRRPLAISVDEWQRIAQTPVTRLLAEGRKFGLELTLANQSVGQLRAPAQVAANVGTLIAFRIGAAESALLGDEFTLIHGADLRRMPPYWAAIRSASGDETTGPTPPPLKIRTDDPGTTPCEAHGAGPSAAGRPGQKEGPSSPDRPSRSLPQRDGDRAR